ncbi:glycosyl transferase [Nitrincola alkalilacustris]|uniref:glycosyl transferase n=1 Tax=Nitrincola alkalilacustris TaxID=1571224 RepID=UPI00124CC4DD|nr:glycosyl transferase [Nitrincola alkalilacustris]
MTSNVHTYTSITANYLPKARVLAESIKRVDPSVTFHLVLADNLPSGFDLAQEPFDNVILADDLPIENFRPWVFSHTVVELCTAVKGLALETIFEKHGADKVFYFDPDMAVFSRLDELSGLLDHHSTLLTPHQTEPETSVAAIMDNEMASLKYGVFNLGFVGVRNSSEGRRFSRWWADRLLQFCHDDHPRGLFTDQKWVNLAPCFFEDIKVLRSPAFNVATWNLTNRKATGTMADGVLINGEPLGFYHFSGFDSGAQEIMLNKYGANSPALYELRNWYIAECELHGQSALGRLPSKFAFFDDGSVISKAHRLLYRERLDLQKAFPDPFSTVKGGYKEWFANNASQTQDFRVLSVDANASFRDVVQDMSSFFHQTAYSGKANSWPKRQLLKLMSGLLSAGVRLIK